jgi:hypothetical protein
MLSANNQSKWYIIVHMIVLFDKKESSMSIKDREHFLMLASASFGEQFREPVFASHIPTSDRYVDRALQGLDNIHQCELNGTKFDPILKLNYQAALIGYIEKHAESWYQEYHTVRVPDTYLDHMIARSESAVPHFETMIIDYIKKSNEGIDNDVFINVMKGILRTADTALGLDEDSSRESRLDALCSPSEAQEHVARARISP